MKSIKSERLDGSYVIDSICLMFMTFLKIILIYVYTYVDVKKDWYRRHIRNYNTLTVRLA